MAAGAGRRIMTAALAAAWLVTAAGCGVGAQGGAAEAGTVKEDKGSANPAKDQALPLAVSAERSTEHGMAEQSETQAGAEEANVSEEPYVESRYRGTYAELQASAHSEASKETGKVAYLTFDDGPSTQTEAILQILRRFGIKATFFVTGHDSDEAKAQYRRIAEEGHRFGNHTFSHDYAKLYRNPELFMEDVRKLDRFLLETVGQKTDILRFPGGSNTRLGRRKGQPWIMPQLVKRVQAEGYQYFDWNVSSTDAAQAVQPKKLIVSSVLSAAQERRKIIVLMHDVNVKTTTVEALPEVIQGLKQMGFTFETLRKDSFTSQFLK